MKHLFYFFMLLVFIGLVTPRSWEQQVADVTEAALESLPDYVTPIAHQRGFSASLSEAQIIELSKAGVKTIIRLNGNTKEDIGPLSVPAEAAICSRDTVGIRFYYFNIEGQIEKAGEEIANLLASPGVVVHCRNGVHRAPAMAAYYLRSKGYTREAIVSLVGWERLESNPGPYKKYTSIVLPG